MMDGKYMANQQRWSGVTAWRVLLVGEKQ